MNFIRKFISKLDVKGFRCRNSITTDFNTKLTFYVTLQYSPVGNLEKDTVSVFTLMILGHVHR